MFWSLTEGNEGWQIISVKGNKSLKRFPPKFLLNILFMFQRRNWTGTGRFVNIFFTTADLFIFLPQVQGRTLQTFETFWLLRLLYSINATFIKFVSAVVILWWLYTYNTWLRKRQTSKYIQDKYFCSNNESNDNTLIESFKLISIRQ